MGRAPSVVIAYQHWVQQWDLEQAVEHFSACRFCVPALKAIRHAGAAWKELAHGGTALRLPHPTRVPPYVNGAD
jgi:hypothetical protein